MSLITLLQLVIVALVIIWLSVVWKVFYSTSAGDFASSKDAMQLENYEKNEQDVIHKVAQIAKKDDSSLEASNHRTISLLSRDPKVIVTSDVKGNLGPASVIVQDPPGKNWIKDRWQAAGDMHGTALPGQHWVVLDFGEGASIHVTKVLIDWEAAFAKNYRIEGAQTIETHSKINASESEWCVLFDGNDDSQKKKRVVEEYGQSPGVKFKMPLHITHTIHLEDAATGMSCPPLRYLRVFINKPGRGWGVSIWELDVYGWKV